MKTCILIFLLTISGAVNSLSAQHSNALLWKIDGNGLDHPSYLYGTMHMICPADFNLSDQVKQALNNSQQLVMEIDMDDPSLPSNMQQLSVNPGMRNISNELSEEEIRVLNKFFQTHYQADLSQLGILKPFTLLSMVFPKGLPCEQPASYEMTFLSHAAEQQWETMGLEKPEDQFKIFDAVPVREQLDWLLNYLEGDRSLTEDISDMVELYKNEDIDGLLELMSTYPEYVTMLDELLFERNERWIEPMRQHMNEKPTFFAVGAAHLSSERGVITLLRELGYTVQPLISDES